MPRFGVEQSCREGRGAVIDRLTKDFKLNHQVRSILRGVFHQLQIGIDQCQRITADEMQLFP